MALPAVAAAMRGAVKGAKKTGQNNPPSALGTSSESAVDQVKAQGIISLWGSLLVAIGMFNIFVGAGALFFLWINCIGWHLLPIARPMLSKPGNEMSFFPPEWRELLHTVALVVMTGVYLLEITMFLSMIILLFSLISELQKFLPLPLKNLF